MEYDPRLRQIVFPPHELSALGFNADETPPAMPDTLVHDLITQAVIAVNACDERLQSLPDGGDPLVRDGFIEDRRRYMEMYGGFCAVRNTIEGSSSTSQQQSAFLNIFRYPSVIGVALG